MSEDPEQSSETGPFIDVTIQHGPWSRALEDPEGLCRRAISRAMDFAPLPCPADRLEVSIVLTDDKTSQHLNNRYRGRNQPTNVLSFALRDAPSPETEDGAVALGDIIIAFETVRREAEARRKRFDHHLTHLVVHGFLHLLGLDHCYEDDAERMENLETRILETFGIADPYDDATFPAPS